MNSFNNENAVRDLSWYLVYVFGSGKENDKGLSDNAFVDRFDISLGLETPTSSTGSLFVFCWPCRK